ncbi:BMP family ABC transporter substrate-binding protein [Pseudohoeflea coraliihabitans]|uniref:BMP family ABC transporter substrate-binding protein n=1 Tax=Pseudohoeflea coraliihabitans TaxID=2860393 RepID=A0ABS6WR05_9HYPH|nr:BMP family ABC transporter substrate-binding protein [Pseudohoeflea sp. DP4N28-3]MBW3098402.1 BMP family ABC transporter substrate-binding protein [Pseudohoeflea sp. DP4N28-3]
MRKTLLALAAGIALAATSGGAAFAQDKFKACFVYIGPVTDGGWTQAHDEARQYVEEQLGDEIETAYLENVPEGPDSERAITRMARSGCNIVFTTSFGYMDPTIAVAEKHPDVMFEHATGYKTADNVTNYNARFYEGRYIIGQIAGNISETGTAGYIASFPIPEVVMGINAFLQGARSVDPDFKLKVVWVNSWHDAGKEADAAKALVDQGVDILTQHTDSAAPMQVAEERGIHAFGQAFDQSEAGPTAQKTAILDTWGPYYVKRIKMAMDGTWKGGESTWDGLKDGILTMAPYRNMPDDVKAMAEETEAKIKSGELHPFTGPINKQDGTEWLAEGETAEDGTLLGMDFYVEGVDDTLPN